jgi:hypothetical protein
LVRRKGGRHEAERRGNAGGQGSDAGTGCDRLPQEPAARHSIGQGRFLNGHSDLLFSLIS